MKTEQSIDQIIDLEYFLHLDAQDTPETLHSRDRSIALEAKPDDENSTNSELIATWIRARRKALFSGDYHDSPGTRFLSSRSLATIIISTAGIAAGMSSGLAFFAYAGTTPINVLEFLLLFVFSQLLLVTLLLCGLLLRKALPKVPFPGSGFSLLFRLGKKFFCYLHKQWFNGLPGETRDAVAHAFGIMKHNNSLYGSLFYWPIFSLNQLFGITFNVGLLASSLLKIVTSDLAFGWQSTLQLSSMAIEKLVLILASPWAWLLPEGTGVPSLEQIAGSRIILKDGIYNLSTTDLVAWWPFLILCLLVYGLLLRTGFFILGRFVERHLLNRVEFRSSKCQALLRRMRTPVLSTQALTEEEAKETMAPESTPLGADLQATKALPQIILIPDEIYESFSNSYLTNVMKKRGFALQEQHRFMIGYEEDRSLLAALKKRQWSDTETIYIVMEAWMVPLVDFITFLADLRALSTPKTPIEVALTGKIEHNEFTDVVESDMDIWRKKIDANGDPYILVSPITGIRQ